jgi:hypothetical protein
MGVLVLPFGCAVQHAIRLDDTQGAVAQQGVGELERVSERLLGKGVVLADPEDLDVQRLELAVVRLPGRQIRRSDGREVYRIELEEYRGLVTRSLPYGRLVPISSRGSRAMAGALRAACDMIVPAHPRGALTRYPSPSGSPHAAVQAPRRCRAFSCAL